MIAEKYGAWGLKKFMGKEYMGILRYTFIIDKNIPILWINKFYSQDFSNDISSKWFVGSYAAEIKKEFSENANCIDAKIFNAYKISKL